MKLIDRASFKWVFVIDHWDIHLTGICKVDDEILFFRMESDQYKGPLEYRVYRFGAEETAYFLQRKAEFEKQVGTHWTYSEDGKTRGPRYVPKPEYAGPNGIPLFYSLPKVFNFREVADRSECVGRIFFPNPYLDDENDD